MTQPAAKPSPAPALEVAVHTERLAPNFRGLDADRSSFSRRFVELVCDGRPTLGRLLDVGCGPDLPPYLSRIGDLAEQHDGVDPFADQVMAHPRLTRRFAGTVESAPLPPGFYDTALAYNVAEHVPAGAPFFAAVRRALRPGGVFWLLTPHARHPFAVLSNSVRLLSLKQVYRRRVKPGANAYPSYYRLNSPRAILRAVRGQPWRRADFWYLPCAQWDRYVPRPLRFLPHAYDRAVGGRVGPLMLILACRLTADDTTAAASTDSLADSATDSAAPAAAGLA